MGHVILRDGLGGSVSNIELIVGRERIREISRHFLDNLAVYSVKLLDQYPGPGEHKTMPAPAIAIYPKLERKHGKTKEKAYRSLLEEHLR